MPWPQVSATTRRSPLPVASLRFRGCSFPALELHGAHQAVSEVRMDWEWAGGGRGKSCLGFGGFHSPHSPMICGKEPLSKSRSTVPVCRQVRSSKRLCRDRVATWGLLQRSPPSSTFSSNFIHLEGVRMGLSGASILRRGPWLGLLRKRCWPASYSVPLALDSQAEDLSGTFSSVSSPGAVVLGQSAIQRMTTNGHKGSFAGVVGML